MASVTHDIGTSPEQVFAVLADGWTYSGWVVGAAHIRAVDEEWPAEGSAIHHSVGAWPLLIEDETRVLEIDPPRRLVLEAQLWPLGEAQVTLELAPAPGGGTRATMSEVIVAGPGRLFRSKAQDLALMARNRECLRRLGDMALHRTAPEPAAT